MIKILIVENDAVVRETLARNLRAEGYDVHSVEDGETGLELARELNPDLVVLDSMLPKMDGPTIYRLLRFESQVPIIMLTERGMEMNKISGLEGRADDYIAKPFLLGEFMARARALLWSESNGLRVNELISGDLRVDVSARKVYLGETELELAPREIDLLATLIRHTGAVLTRDMLLKQVWGEDYSGDARTVDVHIRWLRQKIEDNPSNPKRIVTERGVGYRFEG